MVQLKRKLDLGFQPVKGSDSMQVCGADAPTKFAPDNLCQINLSQWLFKPAGMNHGRVAFLATQKPADADDNAEAAAEGAPEASSRAGGCFLPR